MAKSDLIRKEILLWEREHLIDPGLTKKLLERYPERTPIQGLGAAIALAFGTVLCCLGGVTLVAVNWDCFGRTQRAVLAVLPTLACGFLALWGVCRNWRATRLWEALGLGWVGATVIGTGLVAQTYQMGGSVPMLVLLTGILSYPIVWVTRSTLAALAWSVFPLVWLCSIRASEGGWFVPPGLTPGLVLSAFAVSAGAMVWRLRRLKDGALRGFAGVCSGLVYGISLPILVIGSIGKEGFEPQGILLTIWVCEGLLFGAGMTWGIRSWRTAGMCLAWVASLPTPFGEVVGWRLLPLAILFALGLLWIGIVRRRLGLLNGGLILLLYLLLVRFFTLDCSLAAKGFAALAAGLLLIVGNVVFQQFQRKGATRG
ncbi:MAG: DUF2157 domain-containing protein [Kiritimatiellia bacterium]